MSIGVEMFERKMTATKKELHHMYWAQRMSTGQIAEKYGITSDAVRNWMIKYNIPRRSLYEATLKHPRKPFSGYAEERGYLLGLRAGDIHARKRATNTVGVNVTTTCPSMIKLFERTFEEYGCVKKYPVKGPLTYGWYVYCDLDTSFNFLIEKPSGLPRWDNFYAFLAGYVDSEGTITFDCCSSYPRPNFWIKSQDVELLSEVVWKLKSDGFHVSGLHLRTKSGTWASGISQSSGAPVSIQNTKDYYQLGLYRGNEIARLLKKLMQFSRHREKMERMRLALCVTEGCLTKEEVRTFIQNASNEKEKCIKAAKVMVQKL